MPSAHTHPDGVPCSSGSGSMWGDVLTASMDGVVSDDSDGDMEVTHCRSYTCNAIGDMVEIEDGSIIHLIGSDKVAEGMGETPVEDLRSSVPARHGVRAVPQSPDTGTVPTPKQRAVDLGMFPASQPTLHPLGEAPSSCASESLHPIGDTPTNSCVPAGLSVSSGGSSSTIYDTESEDREREREREGEGERGEDWVPDMPEGGPKRPSLAKKVLVNKSSRPFFYSDSVSHYDSVSMSVPATGGSSSSDLGGSPNTPIRPLAAPGRRQALPQRHGTNDYCLSSSDSHGHADYAAEIKALRRDQQVLKEQMSEVQTNQGEIMRMLRALLKKNDMDEGE
ncbi:hypothetical protein KIPB_007969 [Kipferlia bialata]|uniref:Uncharacterized protein n=1 Tax=Kipferlia bialata TaxID=797122 RepID=A0A9K3D1Q9_9EUKA|nr:hypothetical protein KIPB_007969 [Kipferlia bialata]|eukprot:g7969.t1